MNEVDNRIKLLEFTKNRTVFYLAQCHLAAGEEFAQQRLDEVKSLLSNSAKYQPNLFLCGDMNEHVTQGSELINLFKNEFDFSINENE